MRLSLQEVALDDLLGNQINEATLVVHIEFLLHTVDNFVFCIEYRLEVLRYLVKNCSFVTLEFGSTQLNHTPRKKNYSHIQKIVIFYLLISMSVMINM